MARAWGEQLTAVTPSDPPEIGMAKRVRILRKENTLML